MNRRRCLLAATGVGGSDLVQPAFAQAADLACRRGPLKPLGQERFQIGRIVVDKRAHSFTVPGRVHVLGKPLEYLATSPGGMKEYETLLELDATGSEFNLACILIGLERDPKQAPYQQFSPTRPLVGQRVAIYVAWSEGGQRRKVSAAEALLNSGCRREARIGRVGLHRARRVDDGRPVRRRYHGNAGRLRARRQQRHRIGCRRRHSARTDRCAAARVLPPVGVGHRADR